MEKYRRVEKEEKPEDSPENQIRVTVAGRIRAYTSYATSILEDETKTDGVILLGLGNAIWKALTVSELLRRTVPGLHQVTVLGSVEIKDRWEPLEEGLDALETVRNVSSISVHLAKSGLDTNAAGYQAPLETQSEETVNMLIESLDNSEKRMYVGSSRGRGRRGGKRSSGRPRGSKGPDEGASGDVEGAEEPAEGSALPGEEEKSTKGRKSSLRRRSRRNGRKNTEGGADAEASASTAVDGAAAPASSETPATTDK